MLSVNDHSNAPSAGRSNLHQIGSGAALDVGDELVPVDPAQPQIFVARLAPQKEGGEHVHELRRQPHCGDRRLGERADPGGRRFTGQPAAILSQADVKQLLLANQENGGQILLVNHDDTVPQHRCQLLQDHRPSRQPLEEDFPGGEQRN
ncbi:MAG: hypothetical protein ABR532_00090 [Candidatus Dormibacteria bacterium]